MKTKRSRGKAKNGLSEMTPSRREPCVRKVEKYTKEPSIT